MHDWKKKLSATDALQETEGWKVPYLRFTKSDSPHDTQSWFRDTVFGPEKWSKGQFGQHAVEHTEIHVEVEILGDVKGKRKMLVTHDPTRQNNHSTPNTWLHYDDATKADLQAADLRGGTVAFGKDDQGVYKLRFSK